jgi:hypothetical protein
MWNSKTNIPVEVVQSLFKDIVKDEPWAYRITMDMDQQWVTPHLFYWRSKKIGCVHLPFYHDLQVLADWICHECGHLEDYDNKPFGRIRAHIEPFFRSENIPQFIQTILVQPYYILFFWTLLRKELAAQKTELRLLKKIGLPSDLIIRGNSSASALNPDSKWQLGSMIYQFTLKLLRKRLLMKWKKTNHVSSFNSISQIQK